MDENQLIKRLSKGDASAFEEIFFKYSGKVFGFAMKYIKNDEYARELVQETFVRLWEHRLRLKVDRNLSAYLFSIVKNLLFNEFRKKIHDDAYRKYLLDQLENNYDDLEKSIVEADLLNHIESIIQTLPPKRQLIFKMHRNEGLSHKEIAKKLNLSERTVETHVHLALKQLKSFFN